MSKAMGISPLLTNLIQIAAGVIIIFNLLTSADEDEISHESDPSM